jgi:hypothetical protein
MKSLLEKNLKSFSSNEYPMAYSKRIWQSLSVKEASLIIKKTQLFFTTKSSDGLLPKNLKYSFEKWSTLVKLRSYPN